MRVPIYVVNMRGQPLMPTTQHKGKQLLQDARYQNNVLKFSSLFFLYLLFTSVFTGQVQVLQQENTQYLRNARDSKRIYLAELHMT
ncbi:hypothetical protein [Candidatus Borrarchaeum sp.]|uniref:hypothetical protein n=1 Tax=Candidatus Borrarchaeum sp. TaxID=2846742 RepID=UPI00257C7271|nr:hypothetical protein [Candidatus Borrarchaeum sp.]